MQNAPAWPGPVTSRKQDARSTYPEYRLEPLRAQSLRHDEIRAIPALSLYPAVACVNEIITSRRSPVMVTAGERSGSCFSCSTHGPCTTLEDLDEPDGAD